MSTMRWVSCQEFEAEDCKETYRSSSLKITTGETCVSFLLLRPKSRILALFQ